MKSLKQAHASREEGNRHYKSRVFDKAVASYNTSIRHSRFLTSTYIKALGNKSALQFEEGRYHDCINIINFILSLRRLDLDEVFTEKLNKRLSNCHERLNSSHVIPPAKTRVRTCKVSTCVEITNSDIGRCIVTNRSLPPNKTVFCLKPYAAVLAPDKWTEFCYFCFRFVRDGVIVPCDNCAHVQYCSVTCRDADEYHGTMECSGMDQFVELGILHLSMRVLMKLRKSAAPSNTEDTEITSLCYSPGITLPDIEINTALELMSKSQKTSGLTKEALRQQLQRIAAQMILSASTINHTADAEITAIGCGIYTKVALMNHSCYSNTICLFDGNTIIIKSSREIPKGSQLFNSYGVDFEHHDISTRRSILLERYGFLCKCEYCEDNMSRDDTPIRYVVCSKCSHKISVALNSARCSHCETSLGKILVNLQDLEEVYKPAHDLYLTGHVEGCFDILCGPARVRLLALVQFPDTLLLDWNDMMKKCIMSKHD